MMNKERIFALVVFLVVSGVYAEQGTEETNTTVITSKHLNFDYKRCIAVFKENVEVVDPQIRIKSDELRVLFDKDNNVKSVTAVGNVRLWHGDKAGTCRKSIYLVKKGEVILMGDAVVRHAKGSLMGNKITYWPDEDRMICEPGRLVIFPQEKDNKRLEKEHKKRMTR